MNEIDQIWLKGLSHSFRSDQQLVVQISGDECQLPCIIMGITEFSRNLYARHTPQHIVLPEARG